MKFTKALLSWADSNGWFKDADHVTIDRLPDSAGVAGSVVDIHLSFSNRGKITHEKSLSLKSHHNALKHPRLPRLPLQCGITDLGLRKNYLEGHKRIWDEFYKKAMILVPGTTLFRDLKAKDVNFIDKSLYEPLQEHVISFLNQNANNPANATSFFRFLVGKEDFYVAKNEEKELIIKDFDFSHIRMPSSFQITYPYQGKLSTFLLTFSNGWKITARLHTASSEFFRRGKIQTSTKLDVIGLNIENLIKIDSIKKI